MEPQNLSPESAESPKNKNTLPPIAAYVGILVFILLLLIFILAQSGPQTGNYFGGGRNTDGLSGTYRMPDHLSRA